MAEEVRIARLLLGLGPGDVVLDVACGPGNFTREFARAVGDDGLRSGSTPRGRCSPAARAGARQAAGLGNLALIRGDATALPFRDASLRRPLLLRGPAPVRRPVRRAGRDARVLRPGGRIALMTSVRRQLTLRPLKPLIERASGMRVFESRRDRRGATGTGLRERPPAPRGPGAVRRRPPRRLAEARWPWTLKACARRRCSQPPGPRAHRPPGRARRPRRGPCGSPPARRRIERERTSSRARSRP